MILLKHPLHGRHYATKSEEEAMRKAGWVEDVPEPKPEPAPVVAAVVAEPVKRGPGRPRKE